jgi:hypothetical protein
MSIDDNHRGGHKGPMVGSFRRHGNKAEAQVPVGLERLLLTATADPALRARLKADPRAAASELGFELSASERALLGALTPSALDEMIDGLAPKRQKNKRFLRNVGAAVVVGGLLIATCQCEDELECGATDPDSDVDNDSDSDTDTDQDAGPDAGPDAGE